MSADPYERAPRWLRISLQGVVIYSILVMCLESVDSLGWLAPFFRISEAIVVTIFAAEYLAYLWLAKDRLRHVIRPYSIIDLLAILPYLADLGGGFLALRSFRLLRVLKLARHAGGNPLSLAVRRAAPDLLSAAGVGLVVVLFASIGLYYAEHDMQPETYASIPASMWCVVVTLTTVGYGDMCPVTVWGRLIASCVMLLGIGLIAVPTSLISSNLTDILQDRREAKRLQLRQSVRYRET